ncbi:MAG: hypothetical protein R3A47_05740 [Polyangiales bacterium]
MPDDSAAPFAIKPLVNAIDCGSRGVYTTPLDGGACSITDNGDGTSTIDCGDGGTFTGVLLACVPGATRCASDVSEVCMADGSGFETAYDCAALGSSCIADTGVCDTAYRLVDGSVASEGRIEVLINNEWGTVCDDFFEDNNVASTIVCQALGYGAGEFVSVDGAFELSFTLPILLDDVQCAGGETDLLQCDYVTSYGVD